MKSTGTEKYLPGTTDNFASNEVIVKGLRAADVWPYLTHATVWEKYYSNSSDARYKEDGKHINSFTNKEENIIGDTDILPFMLETELRSHGAIYEQSDPWQVHVTVDSRVITGQNPMSATSVGEAIKYALAGK